MTIRVKINRKIILWALSRAGYKSEEFKQIFPQIEFWLSGQTKPTINQLVDFSRKVHLPFGYLFLDKPPEEKSPIPYFRTEGEDKITLNVIDAIKLSQNRQAWLRSYLEENEYAPLDFVGSCKNLKDYKTIAESIRNTLQIPVDWAGRFKTWWETLEYLSNIVERIGIIITFNSIVGNNTHRPIKVEECRGFVLVDSYAPFMFVNSADAKSAQLFTIAHELAHVWVGQSAGFNLRQMLPAGDPIEKLCDQIAAEFLVSEESFNEAWKKLQDFNELSKYFKVSPLVIARRALDLGKIQKTTFFDFYNEYKKEEYIKKKGAKGGDFYQIQKKRLGLRFAKFVHQAVKEGKLLYRDAYLLTGLSGKSYQKFTNLFLL